MNKIFRKIGGIILSCSEYGRKTGVGKCAQKNGYKNVKVYKITTLAIFLKNTARYELNR